MLSFVFMSVDKEDFKCGDEFIVIECVEENPLSPQIVNERVESLEGWSVKEEIERETYMAIDMEEGIEKDEHDVVFYENGDHSILRRSFLCS